mmetsp:Transcript_23311/g.37935  ORF Transcript_23311/g.37935 Transcript_23311/m.37935 type:complete len:111 (-) Transcript_23311:295-627(-)
MATTTRMTTNLLERNNELIENFFIFLSVCLFQKDEASRAGGSGESSVVSLWLGDVIVLGVKIWYFTRRRARCLLSRQGSYRHSPTMACKSSFDATPCLGYTRPTISRYQY